MIHCHENDQLIGYLGILPDELYGYDSNGVWSRHSSFGWLSCIWVHREYQGKGISKLLLEKANEFWKGNLMATEFVPGLKNFYKRSGIFHTSLVIPGIRIYYGSTIADWLPRRNQILHKIKPILHKIDQSINQLLRLRFKPGKDHKKLIQMDGAIPKISEWIGVQNKSNPFYRTSLEFEWMQKYPWIKEKVSDENCDDRYYFSSCARRVKFEQYCATDSSGEYSIYMILFVKDFTLNIPYLLVGKNANPSDISNFISEYMIQNKLELLKIFGEKSCEIFSPRMRGEIFRKKTSREILSPDAFKPLLEKGLDKIQAGDGDCGFT